VADIGSIIQRASKAVTYAGRIVIVLMVILVVTDVALRYFLNRPVPGAAELIAYSLVILIFSTLAWAETEGGHITVPVLFDRLPPRVRAVTDIVTSFLSLGIIGLICWRSLVYARAQWLQGRFSGVLHIPEYPFIYLVAAGSALYALAVLVNLIKYLRSSPK